ncbi:MULTISPECIES: hypothetical protein [unclassified Bacillus (in: firmicutes)]|uniref:hypothetical protein n=1 Tax=unclassified Bacillus (in: firmicutes) TaxID=185979 RepID=UPI001BE970FB|nr:MULTISPECIES: hypothetical protein [unclassified Bacillus (in: firmicutes)]MBT2617665.1 hypothetical protein [Bacillus sp. ISL-78]MBT2631724.1 hypothetical protein [Bacillus sp. ISL-101]
MKRLLGICISMQMTFVLLFFTGITPKLNSYVGAVFIFSLLIICFTIFIYFLPEAGMPPEIPLFE